MKHYKIYKLSKQQMLSIMKGNIELIIDLSKRAKLHIKDSNYKNYLSDPKGMFIELIYET